MGRKYPNYPYNDEYEIDDEGYYGACVQLGAYKLQDIVEFEYKNNLYSGPIIKLQPGEAPDPTDHYNHVWDNLHGKELRDFNTISKFCVRKDRNVTQNKIGDKQLCWIEESVVLAADGSYYIKQSAIKGSSGPNLRQTAITKNPFIVPMRCGSYSSDDND
tara:strand:- start:826 stop:1305 length:480 start_codon:yes stop_codon:yes gene_type:complete